MSATVGAAARRQAMTRLSRHYLPDLVYGANDGIITTFAVVSGVVGASLSETRDPHPRLRQPARRRVLDGSEQLPRPPLERRDDRADRPQPTPLRHGAATIVGLRAGRLDPARRVSRAASPDAARLPAAVGLTAAALFTVGASRSLVTKRGYLRSGGEMLLVGALAALVAYAIGALVAGLNGD